MHNPGSELPAVLGAFLAGVCALGLLSGFRGSPLQWVSSLRTGIGLLAAVAVASVAGSLIPDLSRAQALVYYSWWYKALLLLLGASMAGSTWQSVRSRFRAPKIPAFQAERAFYEQPAHSRRIVRGVFRCGADARGVAEALARRGYRPCVEGACGHALRGGAGRWGGVVAHLGILLVLLAAFASSWTAREGVVRLLEGDTADTMTGRPPSPGEQLGFTLACDDFDTGFFPRTRIPSHFTSTVTIEEPGRPPRTERVEVNRSVSAGGWKLHQTSYVQEKDFDTVFRQRPDVERHLVRIGQPAGAASDLHPTTLTTELTNGQVRRLPEWEGAEIALSVERPLRWTLRTGGKRFQGALAPPPSGPSIVLRVLRFEPDLTIGADGAPGSRSQNLNNPAVQVRLSEGGRVLSEQWLFAREELKQAMPAKPGPYALDLEGVETEGPAWVFHIIATPETGGEPVRVRTLLGRPVDLSEAAGTAPIPAAEEGEPEAAGGWQVRSLGRVPLFVTDLTLTRNPMIPVVYAGCALMLAGMMLAFFVRRREVWFLAAGGVLRLAVRHRQPRADWDPAIERMLRELDCQPVPAPSQASKE